MSDYDWYKSYWEQHQLEGGADQEEVADDEEEDEEEEDAEGAGDVAVGSGSGGIAPVAVTGGPSQRTKSKNHDRIVAAAKRVRSSSPRASGFASPEIAETYGQRMALNPGVGGGHANAADKRACEAQARSREKSVGFSEPGGDDEDEDDEVGTGTKGA